MPSPAAMTGPQQAEPHAMPEQIAPSRGADRRRAPCRSPDRARCDGRRRISTVIVGDRRDHGRPGGTDIGRRRRLTPGNEQRG